jgi:hypothetical protein
MIRYVDRANLDEEKYNYCIENAIESRVYAFSWYLDIVCDNWGVLVLEDYMAVMPVPYRVKFLIKYVYPPLWIIELGIFSLKENLNYSLFYRFLNKKFSFIEIRLNTDNTLFKSDDFLTKKLQFLNLNNNYEYILNGYNRNRKREVLKAKKNNLQVNWNDNPEKLISIFKENVGYKLKNIEAKDYENLLKLMEICLKNGVGELLTIYDVSNKLLAAAFFLKHKNTVTQLVCASDISNRKNGVHTFFNDRAIFKYQKSFEIYNFGGSSMKNISNYYKSFGAKDLDYNQYQKIKFPSLIRFFKRLKS